MDPRIADEATAVRGLNDVRDKLAAAITRSDNAMGTLREKIVSVRTKALLTVAEMAEAVGKDRNYVDSVWSTYGETKVGKQTRVQVQADGAAARAAYEDLGKAAGNQRARAEDEKTARAERNALIVLVYASGILGPSQIGREVGVDRNHVLRVARTAGVKPVHRTASRNQYTAREELVCPFCEDQFPNPSSMQDHVSAAHPRQTTAA